MMLAFRHVTRSAIRSHQCRRIATCVSRPPQPIRLAPYLLQHEKAVRNHAKFITKAFSTTFNATNQGHAIDCNEVEIANRNSSCTEDSKKEKSCHCQYEDNGTKCRGEGGDVCSQYPNNSRENEHWPGRHDCDHCSHHDRISIGESSQVYSTGTVARPGLACSDYHDTPIAIADDLYKLGQHALPTVCLPLALAQSVDQMLASQPTKCLRADVRALIDYLRHGMNVMEDKSTAEKNAKAQHISEIERLMSEDGLSKSQAQRLLAAKQPISEHKARCPVVTRASQWSAAPLQYKEREGIAYVAGVLPLSYAATLRVLREVSSRLPHWTPSLMLDYASGTGGAVWAAEEVWGPTLSYHCVDISTTMIDLAEALMHEAGETGQGLANRVTHQRFLSMAHHDGWPDLVVGAYGLCECGDMSVRQRTVQALWEKTTGVLVLIEPGNEVGFRNILEAREQILASGGSLLAPCAHTKSCPQHDSQRLCTFGQRAAFTTGQRQILSSPLLNRQTYMIERFCYLVAVKGPLAETSERHPTSSWDRLVTPPMKRKGHVIMHTCTNQGSVVKIVRSRSQVGSLFTNLRKRAWGDQLWPLANAVDDAENESDCNADPFEAQ